MTRNEQKLLFMVLGLLPALAQDVQKVEEKMAKETTTTGKVKDVLGGVVDGLEQIVSALV